MDNKWILHILILISYSAVLQAGRPGFGNITGPSKTDKIAIVGAGPAGIHMAFLLKEKGFTDVTVFEASNQIGGKSFTVDYRGTPHDLGSVYLSPDYEENVQRLAQIYKCGRFVDLPAPSVWRDFNNPLDFDTYIIQEVMAILKTTDILRAAGELAMSIFRYIILHRRLFGVYEGELMPRPNNTVLYFIRGTAEEFLARQNLQILTPLFKASHTVQGYGELSKVSAFYVLLWNTPRLMGALIRRLAGSPSIGIFLLETGFQGLWQRISCANGLNVQLNTRVTEVRRGPKKILITRIFKGKPRKVIRERFDFVMWSPELGTSLRTINANRKERRLFSSARPDFFTTAIVDEIGVRRGKSPVDYWFNNLEGNDHSVIAQRDSFSTLNGISGEGYKNGTTRTGNDKGKRRTMVTYQIGARIPRGRILKSKLRRHFRRELGATRLQVLFKRTFRYFPRYCVDDINKGVIWDIVEEQGKNKIFYIGSSVSFESTKSVVEYNKLLVDLMS